MGWFLTDDAAAGHEGYVIGLVKSDAGETWAPNGDQVRKLMAGDKAQPVRFVQVACDCGWRSRVFAAPYRAEFHPNVTDLNDDRAEARAVAIWKLHVETDAIGGAL